MKMNDIMNEIKILSHSQGFYGRLLRNIEELKENDKQGYSKLKKYLEGQNFKTSVDMVLFFEC